MGGVSFGRAALLGGCNRIWETGDITVFSMKRGDGVELNLFILKQTRFFLRRVKKIVLRIKIVQFVDIHSYVTNLDYKFVLLTLHSCFCIFTR